MANLFTIDMADLNLSRYSSRRVRIHPQIEILKPAGLDFKCF